MPLYDHRAFDLYLTASGIDRDHAAAIRLPFAVAVVTVVFLSGYEHDLVAAFYPAFDCACFNGFHSFSPKAER
jgi:hypothetical protein